MELYMTLITVVHVFGGVAWAGGAFVMALFVAPSVAAAGPEGGKVMQHIMFVRKFPRYLFTVATLTIISGFLLLIETYIPPLKNLFNNPSGISIFIGALFGIVTYIYGVSIQLPTTRKVGRLGAEIRSAEGPPDAELIAKMGTLQAKLTFGGKLIALLNVGAVLGMAAARYL